MHVSLNIYEVTCKIIRTYVWLIRVQYLLVRLRLNYFPTFTHRFNLDCTSVPHNENSAGSLLQNKGLKYKFYKYPIFAVFSQSKVCDLIRALLTKKPVSFLR